MNLVFSLAALVSFGATRTVEAFHVTPPQIPPTRTCVSLSLKAGGELACRPLGIGSAAPATTITNDDLEDIVETSDEWIRTRTGIGERRVLLHGEKLNALSIDASKKALDMAGVAAEDIGIVICASSSPDDMFGDSTVIAAELGCEDAVAFDLVAACSGFLFALVTAGQYMQNGATKYALVVGADALSRWVDWDDRNVCILFGDAAGAMVLSADGSDSPGVLGYSMHSNGKGYCDLNAPYVGSPRHVATPGEGLELSSGSYGGLGMNGKKVYTFATREVPVVIEEALEAAELNVDDVDWLLLHQANIRIMETVAKRLGIPMEKVIANLDKYGNTSAASIPVALDEAVRSGKVKKGDVIACAGFGAGLSWGCAVLRWG
jgi:3-oxoacyl-[acyl-carrier-protein] synthase-3